MTNRAGPVAVAFLAFAGCGGLREPGSADNADAATAPNSESAAGGQPPAPGTTGTSTPAPTATASATPTPSSTTTSTPAPTTTSTPPPPNLCNGYTVVDVGDLQFDGTQLVTSGMIGRAVMVGRIVVPNPLPPGYLGQKASVAAFTWTDDSAWKKLVLSKSRCDFSGTAPKVSQGITATGYMIFGAADPFAVTMQPGEVWYVNIKHELPMGGQSCSDGKSCDFGLRLYPPGN